MKKLVLTLIICLTVLCACKDETETQNQSSKVENFDCETFFKKGDYSSLCFTDSKLPEYISRNCIFDFVTKGNKQEQSIKVQFASKNSVPLAEMSFNLIKSNYKKGKTTNLSNLGDDAFFDVHGTDLKSLSITNKDLHVRYNNIIFVIMVAYQSNTETPCFYNDKDLITFAETIISNL